MAQGFGGMGDGYVCVKCGLDTYHKPLNTTFIPENGDLMHFDTFPYIRKFNEKITWDTDMESWTHYYDRKGNLVEREHG